MENPKMYKMACPLYLFIFLPGLSTSETVSCLYMSLDWKEKAASSTGEWK